MKSNIKDSGSPSIATGTTTRTEDNRRSKIYTFLQNLFNIIGGVALVSAVFHELNYVPTVDILLLSILAMFLVQIISLRYAPSKKGGDDQ